MENKSDLDIIKTTWITNLANSFLFRNTASVERVKSWWSTLKRWWSWDSVVGTVFDLQPNLLNSAQKEHLHPSLQMSVCDLEKLEKWTFKSPDRFTSEDPFVEVMWMCRLPGGLLSLSPLEHQAILDEIKHLFMFQVFVVVVCPSIVFCSYPAFKYFPECSIKFHFSLRPPAPMSAGIHFTGASFHFHLIQHAAASGSTQFCSGTFSGSVQVRDSIQEPKGSFCVSLSFMLSLMLSDLIGDFLFKCCNVTPLHAANAPKLK